MHLLHIMSRYLCGNGEINFLCNFIVFGFSVPCLVMSAKSLLNLSRTFIKPYKFNRLYTYGAIISHFLNIVLVVHDVLQVQ